MSASFAAQCNQPHQIIHETSEKNFAPFAILARIWIDGDKFTTEQQYHDRHGQRL